MTLSPLKEGTVYHGFVIIECVDFDPNDPYLPYLYLMSNGELVWIPYDEYPFYM